MTLVAFPGLEIPPIPTISNNAPTVLGILTMDAAGEMTAAIIRTPKAGTISDIELRIGLVTTGTNTDVRLETVDLATGFPSGSLVAAGSNGTLASGSIVANTWVTIPLTTPLVVTRKQLLAIVLAPTGTPNFRLGAFEVASGLRFPYCALFTASWAHNVTAGPMVALKYNDGSYGYMPRVHPYSAINTHTVNTGTTPDEIALVFTPPGPCELSDGYIWADLDGDADIVLYDSGDNVLTSVSLDKEVRNATGVGVPLTFGFPDLEPLTAGATYRMALKPTSATSVLTYSFDVAAAAILDQLAGGQAFHYRAATDGVWDAAVLTRRPFFGLTLASIDNGAGSGSSAVLVHSE